MIGPDRVWRGIWSKRVEIWRWAWMCVLVNETRTGHWRYLRLSKLSLKWDEIKLEVRDVICRGHESKRSCWGDCMFLLGNGDIGRKLEGIWVDMLHQMLERTNVHVCDAVLWLWVMWCLVCSILWAHKLILCSPTCLVQPFATLQRLVILSYTTHSFAPLIMPLISSLCFK